MAYTPVEIVNIALSLSFGPADKIKCYQNYLQQLPGMNAEERKEHSNANGDLEAQIRFCLGDELCRSAFDGAGNLINPEGLKKGIEELKKCAESENKHLEEIAKEYAQKVSFMGAEQVKKDTEKEKFYGFLENPAKALWHFYMIVKDSTSPTKEAGLKRFLIFYTNLTKRLQEDYFQKGGDYHEYLMVPLTLGALETIILKRDNRKGEPRETVTIRDEDLVQEPRYYYANMLLAGYLLKEGYEEAAEKALKKAEEQAFAVFGTDVSHKLPEGNSRKDWHLARGVLLALYKKRARGNKEQAGENYAKIKKIIPSDEEATLYQLRDQFRKGNPPAVARQSDIVVSMEKELIKEMVKKGDLAALLWFEYKSKAHGEIEKSPLKNLAGDFQGDPLCCLIYKLDQAREEGISLRWWYQRIRHFGYDPLKIKTVLSIIKDIQDEITVMRGENRRKGKEGKSGGVKAK